jgi:transcriptional regulator with XRE-family HTH domain
MKVTNDNINLFTFVIIMIAEMKDRLLEFLKTENKSSAQLAEEIGVQASGISHILSGRNNPSLDFVLKMLEKYRFLSTDWLLFGKGSMYRDSQTQNLFGKMDQTEKDVITRPKENSLLNSETELPEIQTDKNLKSATQVTINSTSSVKKIVWFFENNTFEEFYPNS